MKYCTLCNRYVEPVKSKFNWAVFILLCFCFGIGLLYLLYHLFLKKKNRCPICYTTKLEKYSMEDKAKNEAMKEAKIEEIKENINVVKDKVVNTFKAE